MIKDSVFYQGKEVLEDIHRHLEELRIETKAFFNTYVQLKDEYEHLEQVLKEIYETSREYESSREVGQLVQDLILRRCPSVIHPEAQMDLKEFIS